MLLTLYNFFGVLLCANLAWLTKEPQTIWLEFDARITYGSILITESFVSKSGTSVNFTKDSISKFSKKFWHILPGDFELKRLYVTANEKFRARVKIYKEIQIDVGGIKFKTSDLIGDTGTIVTFSDYKCMNAAGLNNAVYIRISINCTKDTESKIDLRLLNKRGDMATIEVYRNSTTKRSIALGESSNIFRLDITCYAPVYLLTIQTGDISYPWKASIKVKLLDKNITVGVKNNAVFNKYIINMKLRACDRQMFGKNCQYRCNCYRENTCDDTTGYCTYGCKSGYKKSVGCQKPCENGTYGKNCKEKCNCYKNLPCNHVTGHCEKSGCPLHYSGPRCKTYSVCPEGHYGKKCQPCGKCKLDPKTNRICNSSTGECISKQCQTNFQGQRCEHCAKNRYGRKCQYTCGHCLNNEDCNMVTGICVKCAPGYLGYRCDSECDKGRYGPECEYLCTGNCANDEPCDISSGTCHGGCKPGWTNDRCSQREECPLGRGGQRCRQYCGNCLNQICAKDTGHCLYGCISGFMGKNCLEVCQNGSYGRNCDGFCGACKDWVICNKVDGKCSNGCMGQFISPLCQICPSGWFGHECDDTCGNCKNYDDCHKISGACPNGCADGFSGHFCKDRVTEFEID